MPTRSRSWRGGPKLIARARELRRTLTPAERKLWNCLRKNQLDGAYFRRQDPCVRYILDFVCVKAKLVVEVDGRSHEEQVEYDAERTQWLERYQGYRVIRFSNRDVLENIDGVVSVIREALRRG